MHDDTHLKIAEIRASLAKRRDRASENFETIKNSHNKDIAAAAVRDGELQAMLKRIQINAPAPVFGEITSVSASGLPARLHERQLT